jgi:hypothetical protein
MVGKMDEYLVVWQGRLKEVREHYSIRVYYQRRYGVNDDASGI